MCLSHFGQFYIFSVEKIFHLERGEQNSRRGKFLVEPINRNMTSQ